jgi:hypothetical protein
MRRLPTIALAAMLSCLSYSSGTVAQSAQAKDRLSLAQAERMAVDLKPGMTLEEVQKLLGKPKRTALKAPGYGGASESRQGGLQWTYTWSSPSQSERNLQVTFVSKSPEQWVVNGWDWTSY